MTARPTALCPAVLAKRRARAASAFAALSLVAIAGLALGALQLIQTPVLVPPPINVVIAAAETSATAAPRPQAKPDVAPIVLDAVTLTSAASSLAAPQEDHSAQDTALTAAPHFITPQATTPAPDAVIAPVVPETAKVTLPECVNDLRAFAADKVILFGLGSAQVDDSAMHGLRRLGTLAQDCPQALVQIAGHADSTGPDLINLSLSWQRADNILASLSGLGIDTGNFEPVGFGARTPSSQGDSADDRMNRRVEFVVLQTVGR